MPKLIFVIGATATGKTFFIDQNFRDKDVKILNIYDYQQRAYDAAGFGEKIPFAAQFRCLTEANKNLLDDMIEKLSQGQDTVVEHTLFKAKRRISYIDSVREAVANVKIKIYVLSPSDQRWKANLEKRGLEGSLQHYKDYSKEMEFPNTAEGFDAIFDVVDDEAIPRNDLPHPEILASAREELKQEAERIQKENEERAKREELIKSMKERPFWHYCEVCGKKEYITSEEAFNKGWDYPPNIGIFGLLGPRKCGSCLLKDTLFWKVSTDNKIPIVLEGELSPEELVTWRRIKGEPEILIKEEL